MLQITFEYRDEMSKGEWRKQTCVVESLKQCVDLYGLGKDCEYRFISVEEVKR